MPYAFGIFHINLSNDSTALIDDSVVSFVDLKQIVQQKLPETSTVRQLILSEPDSMPSGIGLEKLKIYSRLLRRERLSSG